MTIHGKPLKTRTVSAGRQRTEWQDNMPFVLYSFDGITIEYWNLAWYNNRKFLGRGENDMKIIRDNCSVQLM